MREGREKEARQTLAWLRGADYNLEPELKELEAVVAVAAVREQSEEVKSVRDLVTDRSFLAPLAISCSCFLFQAMCGCDTISYYTGVIFKHKQIRMEHAAIIFQVQQGKIRNYIGSLSLFLDDHHFRLSGVFLYTLKAGL